MTHVEFRFLKGKTQLHLVPEDPQDKELLKLALTGRVELKLQRGTTADDFIIDVSPVERLGNGGS